MSKEKMVLQIRITPKQLPCKECKEKYTNCLWECKKFKASNNKIVYKEYDYEKALNKLTKKIGDCLEQGGDEYNCACCALHTLIGKQI